MNTTKPPRRGTRWLLAIGLMILSPMCAEYLIGYDTSTGDPRALAEGLLILGPLYGAPALLIRELARRFGVRWPGIIALAAALGILQAGVIDQSLFSESYRQIDYWDEMTRPTWIGPLGFAASAALNFLVGHAIWSFCIPIALVEGLCPALAARPWLRLPGLIVTTLLYLGAAALVLTDHLETEADHASTTQIAGSLVVVALLVAVAFTLGRRQPPKRDAAVPKPLTVGVLGLVAALAFNFTSESWLGVAFGLAVLAVSAIAIVHFSRSGRWDGRHVVALATGALLARAILGFVVEPLGDVPPMAKYAHNVGFFLGAALLGAWAVSRNRPSRPIGPAMTGAPK
jgi:hypothetical protein